MPTSFEVPKWYDLHTHFRQGENVKLYIEDHLAMGCAGALAMPNTKPPVSRVLGPKKEGSWSIEAYREDLLQAGGDAFDHLITPLYLTRETTPEMISEEFVEDVEELQPFGQANPEPVFAIGPITLQTPPKMFGNCGLITPMQPFCVPLRK